MVREAEISACSSTMKFLCSYGGRVLPRRSDGKLRYLGGFTRILSVPRTVSFAGSFSDSSKLLVWLTIDLLVANGVMVSGCRADGEARGVLRILRHVEVSTAGRKLGDADLDQD